MQADLCTFSFTYTHRHLVMCMQADLWTFSFRHTQTDTKAGHTLCFFTIIKWCHCSWLFAQQFASVIFKALLALTFGLRHFDHYNLWYIHCFYINIGVQLCMHATLWMFFHKSIQFLCACKPLCGHFHLQTDIHKKPGINWTLLGVPNPKYSRAIT